MINLKQEGQITGIKLEHVSGNLTCNISASNSANLWGCNHGTISRKAKVLTVITDADNEVVFPANIDSSKAFIVPGFNASMSHILVFTNFAYPNYFSTGQELRVWYIQDLFKFRSEYNTVLMYMLQFKKIFMESDLEVRHTTFSNLNADNKQ